MTTSFPPYLESALDVIFSEGNLINIQQHEWEMREFLRLVRDELKPERTVELGTFKGYTSALLSLVTSRLTVSVDIEDYGAQTNMLHGRKLGFMIGDAADPDFVKCALLSLRGPIDLLFIDDGHYYETIVKEFELWRPHVRPGGWIVFHDINPKANIGPHGTQPESIQVPRFWKELEGNKQEIIAGPEDSSYRGTLPHGGIGILRT